MTAKRAGKALADGLFGAMLGARRLLPAAIDDAIFHLPRREVSFDADGVQSTRLWTERACALEPAVDLAGVRWAALDGDAPPPQELVVMRVPRGRVIGRRCAVVAPGGRLVRDASPFLGGRAGVLHPELRRHAWLPRPRRVEGTVLVAGNAGAGNYYHWIVEGLRRLLETRRVCELQGVDLSQAKVAVSRARIDAVDACLRALGFGEDRIIRMGRFDQIEADQVVAASVPTCALGVTAEASRSLRGFRVPGDPGSREAPKRFVVLRRGVRSFLNESEVVDTLAPFGFEAVRLESMPFTVQQALFANAEAMVAPHGAGLVNLAWTQHACEVLEVFPERYLNPCFRRMCAAPVDPRIRHSFLVSPSASHRPDRAVDRMQVDCALLRAWASALGT
jgi:capsular polysaccharide biosynthesis protein